MKAVLAEIVTPKPETMGKQEGAQPDAARRAVQPQSKVDFHLQLFYIYVNPVLRQRLRPQAKEWRQWCRGLWLKMLRYKT